MKRIFKTVLFGTLLSLILYACNDGEDPITDPTPKISNVEAVNHDNEEGGNEIPLGGTVGVSFDATTRSGERLDFYHIEIHDHPESGEVEDEYKIIDSTFKDQITFKGLLNSHVHHHISVPDTANLGSYHVVVVVVDEAGHSSNTEEMELHINIIE